MFKSLNRSCEFFEDVDIPNFYDRSSINNLIATVGFSNYYNKTEIDATVSNINFSNNQYDETYIGDLDNELSTFMLNTCTKTEVDTNLYMWFVGGPCEGSLRTGWGADGLSPLNH